jgi:hypothetical protein
MHITDVQMTLLDLIGHRHTGIKPLDGVSHWKHIQNRADKRITIRSVKEKQPRRYLNRYPKFQDIRKQRQEPPRSEILE